MSDLHDRTREIVERHIDGDFIWSSAQDEPPTAAELARVRAELGCQLPEEFVAHSQGALGGLHVEASAEIWPRPKGGRFWTFLYGVFVYGLGPGIPEFMNLERAARDFEAPAGVALAPCLKVVGNADIYLFDSAGAIVRWDHETHELQSYAGSFFDLLDHELAELRARKNRMRMPPGGSFSRGPGPLV